MSATRPEPGFGLNTTTAGDWPRPLLDRTGVAKQRRQRGPAAVHHEGLHAEVLQNEPGPRRLGDAPVVQHGGRTRAVHPEPPDLLRPERRV
jgi:hypothetical protein